MASGTASTAEPTLRQRRHSNPSTKAESPVTDGLHIALFSIHGLIRGHDLELGRDADTGGQTKYVIELARALALRDDVAKVDLFTRRIVDEAVSDDYAVREEPIGDGARIVRADIGIDPYIRKENLWPYLDNYADNVAAYMSANGVPDVIHSHYADAGYVGLKLARFFALPLIHTGHSLGRVKLQRLLAYGLNAETIETRYAMTRRIEAEERTLSGAEVVIASTRNEVDEQYSFYDCYHPDSMMVIPPGIDQDHFCGPTGEEFEEPIRDEIARFLAEPDKPIILALSRPDERKNVVSLIDAYGAAPDLQEKANLVILLGNRDDIAEMDTSPQAVLTEVLLAIDRHDLHGRVAYPKHHAPSDVPVLYRLTAAHKGVFVNPALTEPFGLTLIEAAASGVPIVATEDGGPRDIVSNCRNGLLIDPLDTDSIAQGIRTLLNDEDLWETASRRGIEGVQRHYTWERHAERYVEKLKTLAGPQATPAPIVIRHRTPKRDRALFTSLDQSLLGDDAALERFSKVIRENRETVYFGVATARRLDSALRAIRAHDIPTPDVTISSGGTEIHYNSRLIRDEHWDRHIDHNWSPRAIQRVMADLPGIERQPPEMQSRFKISYYYDSDTAPSAEDIRTLFYKAELNVNIVRSFGKFIDILPHRASKGQALRYCTTFQCDVPLERVLVVGGSGSDESMLRGNMLGVLVANRRHEELATLDEIKDRLYYAPSAYALGILEAFVHYDFFGECRIPEPRGEDPTGAFTAGGDGGSHTAVRSGAD
jgi:sucrose-phosphate synthase